MMQLLAVVWIIDLHSFDARPLYEKSPLRKCKELLFVIILSFRSTLPFHQRCQLVRALLASLLDR